MRKLIDWRVFAFICACILCFNIGLTVGKSKVQLKAHNTIQQTIIPSVVNLHTDILMKDWYVVLYKDSLVCIEDLDSCRSVREFEVAGMVKKGKKFIRDYQMKKGK